jgi:hypothetical protein
MSINLGFIPTFKDILFCFLYSSTFHLSFYLTSKEEGIIGVIMKWADGLKNLARLLAEGNEETRRWIWGCQGSG